MGLSPHVETLHQKHHSLKEAILQEEQRLYPDQFKINEMKREKLRIKDEISHYRSN